MTRPTTMNGMILTGHGGLEKLVWREDLPVPVPAGGEVLIRVGATSINNTDINSRTGWYSKSVRGDTASGASEGYGGDADNDGSWSGAPFTFPRVQGADCVGEIVATGKGVPATRIGERVLVRAIQFHPVVAGGEPVVQTFGTERDGAFAQYTTVVADDAVPIKSDLSDIELASFPCAFSTAEGMIQRSTLGAEDVLITGASGGVGSAAIQLAKRRGARVTTVTIMAARVNRPGFSLTSSPTSRPVNSAPCWPEPFRSGKCRLHKRLFFRRHTLARSDFWSNTDRLTPEH